jgi:uncharacterized protein YkwD
MKPRNFYVFLLAFGLAVVPSCVSPENAIDYSAGSTAVNSVEYEIEQRILAEVNQLRVKEGLQAVSSHDGLAKTARRHSDFMKRNEGKFSVLGSKISHFGFAGRDDAASIRYDIDSVAENVIYTAVTKDTANHIVEEWYKSPSHKAVMLGKTFTLCGVGIRKKPSGESFGTILMAEKGGNVVPAFIRPGF